MQLNLLPPPSSDEAAPPWTTADTAGVIGVVLTPFVAPPLLSMVGFGSLGTIAGPISSQGVAVVSVVPVPVTCIVIGGAVLIGSIFIAVGLVHRAIAERKSHRAQKRCHLYLWDKLLNRVPRTV